MKKRNSIFIVSALSLAALFCGSCTESFLDQESDTIFTEEEVFSDPNMIKSATSSQTVNITKISALPTRQAPTSPPPT